MPSFVTRVRSWYRAHGSWVGYLIVFSLAFILFAYWQHLPLYADPDSFYHAKLAVLLRDGQFVTDFAWLPFTTLAQTYADQHFLYHLLLVPFVSLTDPLIGLKLATVVLGALMALTFYWFLRRWQIPWALATTVVLLLVNPFSFRMNLAKASSLSLTLLLIGIAAAFAYRPWVLGLLAFCYVWFYGGFPLLVVATLTFAVVSYLHKRFVRRENPNLLLHRIRALLGRLFRHRRVRRLNLRMAVAVLAGTGLGIVLNPFFPANLRFYLDQFVRIGIVNYQKTIGVGGEWYPYGFIDLMANTVLVSIPLVITIVLFFLNWRKQSTRSITLALLWLFFFLLTLKSRRYVEYYVPFALLFVAFSLHDSLRHVRFRDLWFRVRAWFLRSGWARIGIVAFATYVAIVLPTVVVRDLVSERRDLAHGFRLDLFADESRWIAEHSHPGAVVFHSDWDEFPTLFYFNSYNRYIAGLDPTFLYLEDPTRYRQWANVTLGKETGDVYEIIRGSFNADFVFVEHDHQAMDRLIAADDRFSLVYDGPDAKVYQVD
ncbi:MAG: hypothetical protein HY567_00960 [Candidatus Kerfeldbacteria bacterium]|nr:hypothetical protein [Candidatus Kerfeldbacteria bacterium]